MKRVLLSAAIALVATCWQAQANAQDGISLGIPAYGGNGCPQGTASAVLSPDATSLSILFDQYQAEAGGITGLSFARASCNLAVPVHVPQGFSVAIAEVDYRGFNELPAGARSQLSVTYFFAGYRGPTLAKNFVGPLSDNYIFSNQLTAVALVWSPCGQDVNLRANTSMLAISNRNMDDTLSTVDSIDVQASLIYHLQWRTCN